MRSTERRAMQVAALAAFAISAAVIAQEAASFQGPGPEEFLSKGTITQVRDLGTGITRPQRATLKQGEVSHDAVFKSIDVLKQGATTLADGSVEVDFQDSWQTEIAAYALDRLIGLEMVPATVERRIGRDVGSLQWWVDSMMTEGDRVAQGLAPPDLEAWNRQMFKVRLFDQMIANTDRHPKNMLVTKDFGVRLIDHSRSFRPYRELKNPELLTRFSRSLLEGIQTLTRQNVKEHAGRYISNSQIDRLLQRRDAIVALARERVAALGEAAVIYP